MVNSRGTGDAYTAENCSASSAGLRVVGRPTASLALAPAPAAGRSGSRLRLGSNPQTSRPVGPADLSRGAGLRLNWTREAPRALCLAVHLHPHATPGAALGAALGVALVAGNGPGRGPGHGPDSGAERGRGALSISSTTRAALCAAAPPPRLTTTSRSHTTTLLMCMASLGPRWELARITFASRSRGALRQAGSMAVAPPTPGRPRPGSCPGSYPGSTVHPLSFAPPPLLPPHRRARKESQPLP